MPESWQFSPRRLRGHRDRVGLSRAQLGAKVGVSANAIKQFEYGTNDPKTRTLLSLADSLGISPNDLCRRRPIDDQAEYEWALRWSPPPPTLMRRS